MMLHAPPNYPSNGHCENPERLRSIIKKLTECSSAQESNVEILTKFPEASATLVNDTHGSKGTGMYYDYIQDIYDPKDPGQGDIYANEHTRRAILLAAKSLEICVDKIYKEKTWKNAYAAIRPPGHHAAANGENNCASGFCFVNNVVCGVRHAQKTYGVKRIAVFDWDVHHGDSSQRL
jgi:acetoin utilization deacetylase AcuC-like enzyme